MATSSVLWCLKIAIAFFAISIVGRNNVESAVINTTAIKVPSFTLNNGKEIPCVGYGTFQATDDTLEKALDLALETGYRHIDTAYVYYNEKVIGKVIKRWISEGKLKREDLFLVSKLPSKGNRPEGVSKYLKKSLEDLQVDYVDLYLIHTPFGVKDMDERYESDLTTDLVAIWKAMEKQVDAGLTKAIGVSNFNQSQIERLIKNSRIKPSNNQIELHAYLQQNELVDFCQKNNISITAYSPLASPGLNAWVKKFGVQVDLPDLLQNPTVKAIAKKHSKTEAQVLLRFDIQRGIIPIPKSTNPGRLRENLDIFDFELDAKDLQELKALDADVRVWDFGKLFVGTDDHPEYPFPKTTKNLVKKM